MGFYSKKSLVTGSSVIKKLRGRRTLRLNVTYLVLNRCRWNSGLVRLLISPDNKVWMEDGAWLEVPPGKLIAIVPNTFAAYSTVEYKSKHPATKVRLTIWLQMNTP